MARTIAQIQASIITAIQGDATLAGLSSTSSVAVWRLLAYVVAVCQWTIENLFDTHVAEVNTLIAAQKPHTLQWYAGKAKAFQYGCALPDGSDVYDNSALSPDQVAASQVIAYAAATESQGGVRVKVAKLSGGALTALSTAELDAFTTYMKQVRDAGVRLLATSSAADRFLFSGNIYYDPLVLDGSGRRLDGTADTPVQDAITAFLAALPFNGRFTLNYFTDALQAIPGVDIVQPLLCQAAYASTMPVSITVEYQPDSGYLGIDLLHDLNLTFIPH